MGWDPVPWVVSGGTITPETARMLSFMATGGGEGVADFDDAQVLALASPGGSVRIEPAAVSILCRTAGFDHQTYVGRLPAEDTLAIPSTGGTIRSDLIVARVEDPAIGPWAVPPNPATDPYIFTRRLPGVPAGTTTVTALGLGYSAIPLARIDLPVSTTNITQAMIKDLRSVVGDTGDQTTNPPWLVPASGWGTLTSTWRIKNRVLYLQVNVIRTGSAISVGSTGNIVGDPAYATITDINFRPKSTRWTAYRAIDTGGTSEAQTGGDLVILDGHSNSDIATGDALRSSWVWPLR